MILKAPIPAHLLAYWFCKSLLPPIAKDVALVGAIMEDQSIYHAQNIYFFYSQSGMLCDLLPLETPMILLFNITEHTPTITLGKPPWLL